jgi:hypothetical protein
MPIAISIVPVMLRLLTPKQLESTAGTRQSHRQRAALEKGRPRRKSLQLRDGQTIASRPLREASDRCRTAKRHSIEWRFVRLGCFCNAAGLVATLCNVTMEFRRSTNSTCQQAAFAVVSDLPIKRLTRATPDVEFRVFSA